MSSYAMRRHLENSGYKILPISPGNAGSYASSIPLILPNDLKYDLKRKSIIKKNGVQRTSLYLVPEALELLNSVTLPLAVMAICGPMRTGKSYILSRLLGEPDAFELGHAMDPKTMGIWMGTKILQGKDKNGNEQAVLLLDTEGIDAPGASLSQDAGILVLTILISSVPIYNSQSVPKKNDLEKLDCFIHLAEGFEVKRGKEIQGGEVSQYFPHFTWLLRDVNLAIKDDNGNEMDPTDYIKKNVAIKLALQLLKKIRDASLHRDGKTYPLEEHEAKNFGDATLMGLHGETLQVLTEKLLKKMAHFGVGDVKGLKKNSEELVNSFQERIKSFSSTIR